MNKKNFIPLSVPNLSLDILDNVKETIETGWVSTGGRFITEFENKVAQYTGMKRAVGCQSGTAGLHLALCALKIGYNDEVIAPTLAFIAAVNPVTYVGAKPIFMDCDETLGMDADKLEQFLSEECEVRNETLYNNKSGNPVKAIIVVHVFGNPANLEKIMTLAKKYNLPVIEDATEALGSFYKEGPYAGKHCGSIGDIGVFSFNANKILTTGGGGMIISQHEDLLEKMAFWGAQAKTDPLYFIHDEIGFNYRMLNINAAFGTDQIDRLEDFIATKIKNYNSYKEGIKEIPGLTLLPFRKDTRANHWFYSIMVDEKTYGMNRDQLLQKLIAENIQTRPLWGLVHHQKPYKDMQAFKIEKAQFYEKNLLNVPCSSNLTEEQVQMVIRKLKN